MATAKHTYVMQGDLLKRYVASMVTYQTIPTTRIVSAVQMQIDFAVVYDSDAPITGHLDCKAGCWLVCTEDGAIYAVSDGVFQRQYEEITDHEHIEGVTRH